MPNAFRVGAINLKSGTELNNHLKAVTNGFRIKSYIMEARYVITPLDNWIRDAKFVFSR